MNVTVTRATERDRDVLARLQQLYQYDFSEIEGGVVQLDGLFHYLNPDDAWTEPERVNLLIHVDGALAGFVMVRTQPPEDGGQRASTVHVIDEFFVMRGYRRLGIGALVARQIFDTFPGAWELSQTQHNLAARAFWRKVIRHYTGGRFEERQQPGNRWRATVHTFNTRDRR